ncbi:MAG: glycosyltransferase [Rhodothermia bacterium]|nr:MAG: glycosyltransferase [Rhodothermia bacterium]
MKRVLFMTYYFPPSGGPGVQRSLKFVKYLPEFGWQPTVLTVDPDYAAYPALDLELVNEIPASLDVIRTKSRDPYFAYGRLFGKKKDDVVGVGFLNQNRPGTRERLARWVRANLFIPDARKGWVSYAAGAAVEAMTRHSYDAIFSTGPPHSTHLIAQHVKRRSNLPWVMDLRDAWPPDSFAHLLPMSEWARSRDARIRRSSFTDADVILTVGKSLGIDLGVLTETPVKIIPNGYDPDDFNTVEPLRQDSFTIVYAGNMSAEQDPIALWQAMKTYKSRGDWQNLRVCLVGNTAGEVQARIEETGLRKHVDVVSYVEHHEAVRYMCGADLLLLSINRVPNPGGIVTGKLYEYLATGRPILCLMSGDGDASAIIDSVGAGESHRFDDGTGVGKMIDRHYQGWKAGTRLNGAPTDRVDRFSRRTQTKQLAEILSATSGEER